MDQMSYRVLLQKEPNGGYTAIVPTRPGCVTFGDSIEGAITLAKEAIELYLERLRAHGDECPTERSAS